MKTSSEHLSGARAELAERLFKAGWPRAIGPNDKTKACHNRFRLDGELVHTFWTRGGPLYVYVPGRKLVLRGADRDELMRQIVQRRDSGM